MATHGSRHMYERLRCRCDACRAANAARQRDHKRHLARVADALAHADDTRHLADALEARRRELWTLQATQGRGGVLAGAQAAEITRTLTVLDRIHDGHDQPIPE